MVCHVVVPVPPFAAVRALARVRAPVEEKEEVAVAPKYAGPYEEKSVVDADPLNSTSEVVAETTTPPTVGCVKGSPPPLPVTSVPHTMPPCASVSSACEQPRMLVRLRPLKVEEAVEAAMLVAEMPPENVDVPLPCTTR